MKLDAIKLTERRPARTTGLNSIKSLEQKLRTFFSESDGHGSLVRKPPENMVTAKYFNVKPAKKSMSFIDHVEWLAFMKYANYKKIFAKAEKTKAPLMPKAISNVPHNGPKKK